MYVSGRQTVARLQDFIERKKVEGFLHDVQPDQGKSLVEDHVIRNACKKRKHGTVKKASEEAKLMDLKTRIKEEKETLFFITHDECHYAPLKNGMIDQFLNDSDISSAPNVVLLQVSATPYSMVTQNSRIPEANRLDIVEEVNMAVGYSRRQED
jgi:hypothetical protein